METISPTAKIYPNVQLGENVIIEDFCVVGAPSKGKNAGELETVIGDNAVIRSHTVIYAGNIIGKNFQTGNKANIRELNNIGDNVSVGTMSVIEHHVVIENDVRIHTQVFIPEFSTLKKGSWIGPNVVLTNARYPNSPSAKDELIGPTIEENATVSANVTILPGIIVGKNSLIGAGAVVTKNVSQGATVVGNPAKEINK